MKIKLNFKLITRNENSANFFCHQCCYGEKGGEGKKRLRSQYWEHVLKKKQQEENLSEGEEIEKCERKLQIFGNLISWRSERTLI